MRRNERQARADAELLRTIAEGVESSGFPIGNALQYAIEREIIRREALIPPASPAPSVGLDASSSTYEQSEKK